jgi:hypothetical protein
MGSSAEHFDAWFKERLEHFEELPREAAWENLAEKLGHTRKKRVMVFILRIAAGMALTLSLGLGYYYFIQHRGISVPASLTENQQLGHQPLPDDTKTAVTTDRKALPETASSDNKVLPGTASPDSKVLPETTSPLSRHSSTVQSENFPLPLAGQTGISGQVTPVTGSDYENKSFVSYPAYLPAEINPLPATIRNQSIIPGLALRQERKGPKPLSETDLIVAENLARMNAGGDEKNKSNDWIVGGQLAPLYSYRNLNSDNPGGQDLNKLNDLEKGVMAYAGGIALAFKPAKRWSVESGVYYSKYGQEKTDINAVMVNRNSTSDNYETGMADGTESFIQVTITNSTGTITNQKSGGAMFFDSDKTIAHGAETNANVLNIPTEETGNNVKAPDNLTAYQYFNYLEVPLIVKYKVIDRKLDFNLLGGISTNFLAGNSVKISDDGKKYDYGETDEISKVNYSGSVGIGFEYPVLANLVFNIEPKFRYFLNPIDKSVYLNVYPYSFGLFAGISYIF